MDWITKIISPKVYYSFSAKKYFKILTFFIASETINLKRKDHIKWNMKDFQRSSRLSLRMRLKAAQPDGVLFFTKRGGNIVALELEKGFLRVAGGKATKSKKQCCVVIISSQNLLEFLTFNLFIGHFEFKF